jgi:hypothetical protein
MDTITDFAGIDKIQLDRDLFSAFTAAGTINAANLKQGAGAVASKASEFLVFDSDKILA